MPYLTEDEVENVLARYEKGVYTTSCIHSAVDIRFEDKSKLNHIETVPQMFFSTAQEHGDVKSLASLKNNSIEDGDLPREDLWNFWTFSEFYEMSTKVAKSLIKLGHNPKDVSCIIGPNSPNWLFANMGSILAGGIGCGIYTTNSAQACSYVIRVTKSKFIFCNEKQLKKINQIRKELPHDLLIVLMNETSRGSSKIEQNIYKWQEFIELGNEVDDESVEDRISKQRPNECCQLVFTSGTNGKPRGVMLSHDNITWSSRAFCQWSGVSMETLVSYLPLSHITAQMCDLWAPLVAKCCVYFAPEDALKGKLAATVKLVRPTVFLGVPRVWEKIVMRIDSWKEGSWGRLGEMWQRWCESVSLKSVQVKSSGGASAGWMGRRLAQKSLERVGRTLGLDRCWLMGSVAAPLGERTQLSCWSNGIQLVEMYGLSESCGPHVCSVSLPGKFRFQSVGKSLPGTKVRVDHQNNEICLWGRNICMGYLSMSEEMKGCYDNQGWLMTGDKGHSDEDGFLFVTGRLKDLIITSGGKNVPSLRIEASVRNQIPDVIQNCFVLGDSKNFLSVLLTFHCKLDDDDAKIDDVTTTATPGDELSPKCVKVLRGWGSSAFRLSQISFGAYPEVEEKIRTALENVNSEATSNDQKIRKWAVLPESFTVKGGELGPTLKVRRNFINKKYSELIERFYSNKNIHDNQKDNRMSKIVIYDV